MAMRKASDVFVECLEAEGVKHVFGIPGEETLDLTSSCRSGTSRGARTWPTCTAA
jgi:acetolactate synthase-1/2/3 large subunit